MNQQQHHSLDGLSGLIVEDGQLAQSVTSASNVSNNNSNNIQLLIGLNGGVTGYHQAYNQELPISICSSTGSTSNQAISIVSSSNSSSSMIPGTDNVTNQSIGTDPTGGYTLYQVQYGDSNQLDSYEQLSSAVHQWNKPIGQIDYQNEAQQHHLILQQTSPHLHQQQQNQQQQQILVQQQSADNSQQLIWTSHHPQNYHVTAVNSPTLSNGLSLQSPASTEMYLSNGSTLVPIDSTSLNQHQQLGQTHQIMHHTYPSQHQGSSSTGQSISLSSTSVTVPTIQIVKPAAKKTSKRGQKAQNVNSSAAGKSSESSTGGRTSKPVSAYALFFRDTQASVKADSPSATFGDVSKIVASKWEVLPKGDKDVYKERADQEKRNYLQNLASSKAKQVAGLPSMATTSGGVGDSVNETTNCLVASSEMTIASNANEGSSNSSGPSSVFMSTNQPSAEIVSQPKQQSPILPDSSTVSSNIQYQPAVVVVDSGLSSMLSSQGSARMMMLGSSNPNVPVTNGMVVPSSSAMNSYELTSSSSNSAVTDHLSVSHLSYHDPSSFGHHHQLPSHHPHHQSTHNPVMSQSSYDQFALSASVNSQSGSNGHHQLHHHNQLGDSLSLINDGSYFNSVDVSSANNLIDSLGIDLTDLDDNLNSLLSSGGILSPGSSSVFDSALDANDYLMGELGSMNDGNNHNYSSLAALDQQQQQQQSGHVEDTSEGNDIHSGIPHYADSDCQPCSPPTHSTDHSPTVESHPNSRCIRSGCDQLAVESVQWDNEFCSEQCCVKYCSQIFQSWTTRPERTTSPLSSPTDPQCPSTIAALGLGPGAGSPLPALPAQYIAS